MFDFRPTLLEFICRLRREAQESIEQQLLELVEKGLFVYGRRVDRMIKGGVMPPSPWPTIWIVILTAEQVAQNVATQAAQL